jgi:hypothetical protein
MKVSSRGLQSALQKTRYGLDMVKQPMARMFKREIRKFLMAGTLTAMITTVKDCAARI